MPLRLYLFGPLRAFVNEEPIKFPPRSKVGAPLAYLLLQRERHRQRQPLGGYRREREREHHHHG